MRDLGNVLSVQGIPRRTDPLEIRLIYYYQYRVVYIIKPGQFYIGSNQIPGRLDR